jgi:hypothetical protein
VGRNDYTCDDPDNEGNDDPIPDDVGENNPDEPDTDVDLPNPGVDDGTGTGLPTDRPVFPGGTSTTGYPPSGSPTGNNADDPFDTSPPGTISGIPTDRPLLPGDELVYTPPCCPAEVLLYAIDPDTGEKLQEAPVAIGTAVEGDCEVRFEIFNEYLFDTATAFYFTHRCVDPGAPGGYGPEVAGGTTPSVGGDNSDQAAITADPPEATQFEVIMPLDDPYSQYRYITSITGPMFYLEEGTFTQSGLPYNRRIRLRWTDVNGNVLDVIPGFWVYRRDPPAFPSDNKPWGCSFKVAATGEPWPFI